MTPDPGTKPRLWKRACAAARRTRPVVLDRYWTKGRWAQPKATIQVVIELTDADRRRVQVYYWRAKRNRKRRARRGA